MKRISLPMNEVIVDTAMGYLREDDAYPDVGMGMFPRTAVMKALARWKVDKADVDFENIVALVTEARRR